MPDTGTIYGRLDVDLSEAGLGSQAMANSSPGFNDAVISSGLRRAEAAASSSAAHGACRA